MATLHDAFQSLSPIAFEDVPSDDSELKKYLQGVFFKGQLLIDSVPAPPPDPLASTSRPRSNTAASAASNLSEISSSSARAEPLIPAHGLLQKEWGKPIKLSAKENPMGIGVYKLSGKDGRAWFARRSVHEGMPYTKWKNALQQEFPESLEVQGAPGEGNIRGIGAEKIVIKKVIDGVGCLEVYHLSAQFPGPTTPRDFVTLLLTSSAALSKSISDEVSVDSEKDEDKMDFGVVPRHYMVISRPCKHPDCPPRSGFVRGEYESIEFIREVPLKPKRSSSAIDLIKDQRPHDYESSVNREAILRHAQYKSGTNGISYPKKSAYQLGAHSEEELSSAGYSDGRARGRTISFAESRGIAAKGEAVDRATNQSYDVDEAMNPVEWIMITRSDPGGNVPRFMVERGTPSSIVADASKFLSWACKNRLNAAERPSPADQNAVAEMEDKPEVVVPRPKIQPRGLDGTAEAPVTGSQDSSTSRATETNSSQSNGLLSAVASAAYAGLETYAPKAVVGLLPAHQQTPLQSSSPNPNTLDPASTTAMEALDSDTSSSHSVDSYASADSHLSSSSPSVKSGEISSKSMSISPISSKDKTSVTTSLPPVDRALAKLAARKTSLEDKLRKTREKETKDRETLTSKEEARVQRAEEKHEREVKRAEEKFEKELKALEAKRKKEEEKERKRKEYEEEKERKRKEYEEEKEQKRREAEEEKERKKKEKEAEAGEVAKREKGELLKEIEALKRESSRMKTENEALNERLGDLQKENTALVAGLGQLDGGQAVLKGLGVKVDGESPTSSLNGP